MTKLKFLFPTLFISLLSLNIFALEVNQSELQNIQNQTIVFENYTGPHARVDTLAEIKGIGVDLGKTISAKITENTNSGSQNKYFVIHAIDASEKTKLDADILIIGKDATVDHIRNLRHIIASYLSSAYGYTESDSETIANFITVYNAVYRGNLDSFKEKYKNIVIKNLSNENVGLAINYKDWPGKSEIVIPLSDIKGGLSTIDTSVISDKNVVQSMQEDDNKNIEDRKKMVDIKEREADNATEKAQDAQKNATKETEKLAEEKKELQTQKAETQKKEDDAKIAEKKAQDAQMIAEKNPNDKKAQETANETRKEADEKKKEADEASKSLEKKQSDVKKQETVATEAKKEAENQQQKADKKTAEAQSERTEISKDQEVVIKEAQKNENVQTAFGIRLLNSKNLTSCIVKINSETNKIISESPVKVIRNRSIYETSNGFIAIAGENTGNGAIKLVLINKDTLEIDSESKETVAESSVLVKDGANYYCIISDGKNYTLGKYNGELSLESKSSEKLMPETPITITSNGIIVTGANGKAILLNSKSLQVSTK